jgi:hypothetical protein
MDTLKNFPVFLLNNKDILVFTLLFVVLSLDKTKSFLNVAVDKLKLPRNNNWSLFYLSFLFFTVAVLVKLY